MRLDIRIETEEWTALDDIEPQCLKALIAAGRVEGRAGEVSVLLTDDAAMQVLNETWRGKDKPTDVLSFSAGEMSGDCLGDIAIGYGIASKDAKNQGISLADHLAHLLIHGFLHLCGHDHMEDTDAAKMMALEVTALASLGIPDPYSPEPKTRL